MSLIKMKAGTLEILTVKTRNTYRIAKASNLRLNID